MDPNRPIKISFADYHRAIEYKDGLDIVACHVYPMPYGKVTAMADAMRGLAAAFGGTVPIHATPQAWMSPNDVRRIEQTVAQTRAMTYLAIIHGAKGLYYYPFIDHGTWDLRQHPRLWSTFKRLTWEIETLSRVVLKGRRARDMSAEPPAVQLGCWDYGGSRYVIAVNTSDEPVEAKFHAPGFGPLVASEMFGEDRWAGRGVNQLVRPLGPLETSILKVTQ